MDSEKSFEAALMDRLSHPDMDKNALKKAASTITELHKSGLKITGAFPKGKIRPDRILINGTVDPEFWGKIGNLHPKFDWLKLFPVGILPPDHWGFEGGFNVTKWR